MKTATGDCYGVSKSCCVAIFENKNYEFPNNSKKKYLALILKESITTPVNIKIMVFIEKIVSIGNFIDTLK